MKQKRCIESETVDGLLKRPFLCPYFLYTHTTFHKISYQSDRMACRRAPLQPQASRNRVPTPHHKRADRTFFETQVRSQFRMQGRSANDKPVRLREASTRQLVERTGFKNEGSNPVLSYPTSIRRSHWASTADTIGH